MKTKSLKSQNFKHTFTAKEFENEILHHRIAEFDLYLWRCPYGKDELVFEGYAKCEGGIKHLVHRYEKVSFNKAKADLLQYGTFSPRPYQLAQSCDGSITTCALALFFRFCRDCGHDAEKLFRAAYTDGRKMDWNEVVTTAEWEGVAYPARWDEKAKAGLLESLHEVNYHSLAGEISDLVKIWRFDGQEKLIAPDGKRFDFSPISLGVSAIKSPAAKVKTARERAVVFLRMLRGAHVWNDGNERKIDDCFEMYDGDDVVRNTVAIAEAIPNIKNLLLRHRNVGEQCYLRWKKFAEKEAQKNPELPLSV